MIGWYFWSQTWVIDVGFLIVKVCAEWAQVVLHTVDSGEGEQEQDHDAVMSLVSHYDIIYKLTSSHFLCWVTANHLKAECHLFVKWSISQYQSQWLVWSSVHTYHHIQIQSSFNLHVVNHTYCVIYWSFHTCSVLLYFEIKRFKWN